MFYSTDKKPPLSPDPFKQLIVPRPIGWISTVAANGSVNLAPFSFFNAIADDPPMVGFGVGGSKPDRLYKDSRANVEETGEFVFNLATWDTRRQMNLTSGSYPAGVDEFRESGLTPAPSELVKPPRVAEAPVHFECRHFTTVELPADDPNEPNVFIIGQVIGIHIDDRLIKDGRVDIVSARPIARLGYSLYTITDNMFPMRRPDTMTS
jgi:flavin reductase (DIM6/NTAB) family NADH-FMN oxidoreductase RutF